MAETLFDRAERGLGSADLSVPDIVAKTKGNPQEIMKLVMGGQINLTQALLAKRLSDSIKSDPGAAQQPTVLQEQFPQLAQATGAAPPMPQGGGLGAMPPQAMPPQMGPQGMPPQGGGIGGLDFAAAPMAQGGIVGYAVGDTVEDIPPEMIGGIPAELFAQLNPALDIEAAGAQLQGVLPTQSEAMERLRSRLEAGFDPEKERKRAELAGLFAGLGSVQAGMSPMEALVSGFVGSGRQIQESKKEMEDKEMELLRTSAEIEESQNRTAREIYGLQLQLAEAERSGASDVVKAQIEALLAEANQKFQKEQNELERTKDIRVAGINAAARGKDRNELSSAQVRELSEMLRRTTGDLVSAGNNLRAAKAKAEDYIPFNEVSEEELTELENEVKRLETQQTDIQNALSGVRPMSSSTDDVVDLGIF